MHFGKIHEEFWKNPELRTLDVKTMLLAVYLLTCPHHNSLGCFFMPVGYILADIPAMKGPKFVKIGLRKLSDRSFIALCERSEYVFIYKYLKWNPPTNENHCKGTIAIFRSIPDSVCFYGELIDTLISFFSAYKKHPKITDCFLYDLKALRKGFESPQKTLSKGSESAPKHIDIDKDKDIYNIYRDSETEKKEKSEPEKNRKAEDEILKVYNELLTEKGILKNGFSFTRCEEIRARIRENKATLNQFMVIANNKLKDRYFLENPKYFRPETIFAKKHWDSYLNEANLKKKTKIPL